MTPKKNIRLKKMVSIGTSTAHEDTPMLYRTAAQAAAMESLKEALTRPVDDPRRLGNIQDALYTLTHGDNAMTEDAVQKEVETFLAEREKAEKERSDKLAQVFAGMMQKPAATKTPQSRPKPSSGPRP